MSNFISNTIIDTKILQNNLENIKGTAIGTKLKLLRTIDYNIQNKYFTD